MANPWSGGMTKSFKGVNARIVVPQIDPDYACAYAESASVDIATNVEAAYSLGSAAARTISAGNVEITGTLSGYWIDVQLMNLLGRDTCDALENTFDIVFYSSYCESGGAPYIYVYGCKADGMSFDFSQDGFLMHDLDFMCVNWSYGTYST